MKTYLDIDGVLLKKDGTLAEGFDEFLDFFVNNHDCYWLTTHCKGGSCDSIEHITRKNAISENSLENLKKVKVTDWNENKTEAIDFSKDFLWLDDFIFSVDREVLKKNNTEGKVIEINLKDNPNQLIEVIDII